MKKRAETSSFRGLIHIREAKSVNISIDNPEEFLNAIKIALADSEAQPIRLGKAK
jgi:hypothetical protein